MCRVCAECDTPEDGRAPMYRVRVFAASRLTRLDTHPVRILCGPCVKRHEGDSLIRAEYLLPQEYCGRGVVLPGELGLWARLRYRLALTPCLWHGPPRSTRDRVCRMLIGA